MLPRVRQRIFVGWVRPSGFDQQDQWFSLRQAMTSTPNAHHIGDTVVLQARSPESESESESDHSLWQYRPVLTGLLIEQLRQKTSSYCLWKEFQEGSTTWFAFDDRETIQEHGSTTRTEKLLEQISTRLVMDPQRRSILTLPFRKAEYRVYNGGTFLKLRIA